MAKLYLSYETLKSNVFPHLDGTVDRLNSAVALSREMDIPSGFSQKEFLYNLGGFIQNVSNSVRNVKNEVINSNARCEKVEEELLNDLLQLPELYMKERNIAIRSR